MEPSANNKDIYKIDWLQNSIIQIESPRKGKHLVQCMRCQLYGHTKSYCNRPYVCVKCVGQHSTDSCKKSRTTPVTYALCGGGHPANYKGCDYYQKQYQAKYANNRPQDAQRYTPNLTQPQPAPLWPQNKIYAQALKADSHITCCSPACRAAKGLECVFLIWFTQWDRVLFTLAMPCPCHAPTMSFFSRPRHSTSVERRPVGYLPAFGFFRLPRGVPRRSLSHAYQSQMQVASVKPNTVCHGRGTEW